MHALAATSLALFMPLVDAMLYVPFHGPSAPTPPDYQQGIINVINVIPNLWHLFKNQTIEWTATTSYLTYTCTKVQLTLCKTSTSPYDCSGGAQSDVVDNTGSTTWHVSGSQATDTEPYALRIQCEQQGMPNFYSCM